MFAGLCLSDPHPDTAGDGNTRRTLSAAHFAGRYRLVDFMLSNMVNSKIYDISMVLNSHFQTLIGHIGMGKEWDLARKSGGVTFFPPYHADERRSVNGELDGPLQRAAEFIASGDADYIVLVDSSIIYNIDYRPVMKVHRKSGADVTAIYTKKRITPGERDNAIVFDITEDGAVTAATQPFSSSELNVSLGAYIMHKKYFLQLTAKEQNCGMLRFSGVLLAGALDRLNVRAYEFKGFSAQICSTPTYFHYNMEMLDAQKRDSLFDFEDRVISTSRRDSLPTKYGKDAVIRNSIIAEGCQIDGTVENSVICRNVRVKPGAIVKNCILQDETLVEKNAELDWVVADRGVIVSENRSMMGYYTYPVYIERMRRI